MIMAKNILDFRSDERLKKIPFFKYHPNPFLTEAFQELSEPEKCECCGKDTLIKYTGGIYAVEEVDCLCPECISDGSAAERFDGEFQDGYSVDKIIDPDGSKIDELIHKTPGYRGIQQECWRAHCNDFCAFLGYVGAEELRELGIYNAAIDNDRWTEEQKENLLKNMVNGGWVQGYLFQCLHCGRYLIWVDYD